MREVGRTRAAVATTVLLLVGALRSPLAQACASCGSGGDDPLILYPNDWLKDYVGLTQTGGFKNVDPDGSLSSAGGPTAKQTLTLAVGYGISPRSFVTLTAPYVRNVRGTTARSAFGDLSLAGRYAIVLPSIDEPIIPQIQLVFGYKHGRARSLRESRERKTQLDVFGTGFSEVKAGVDVWFGMARLKPGFSQLFVQPLRRSFAGSEYEPGLASRTTLSLGYNWFDSWKTTAGINRDHRSTLKEDGVALRDSAQLNHSVFATSDWMVSSANSLRVSFSRQAALLDNYSTSQSYTVAVAHMYSY